MLLQRVDENADVMYFINGNKTMLYIYNIETNYLNKIMKDKFYTNKMTVLQVEKKEERIVDLDFSVIVNSDNDFITPVEFISSTVKDKGFFVEENQFGIKSYYFNEYLGSEVFINSKIEEKYKGEDVITLLKDKTPTINMLIRNLFHNEKDEMILNFINWLNIVSFDDKNQDIMFLFMGTNSQNQGQGAGKGVIQKLLNKMFSGLVCSVSNNSYLNNFNSMLLNKKIVVFDEVNFKGLKYEIIKDITGNPNITIEYKGKEPFISKNVSSWLFFTNEYDLHNKITIDDRRVFIIRPNPQNGSLKRIVNEKFDGDFHSFEQKLFNELEEFIHIISNVDGKVLSPLQLKSQGHIEYFKEQKQISILNISQLFKVFTENNFRNKLYEVFDVIIEFDERKIKMINECKFLINSNTINYKIFKSLFKLLQEYEYISKTSKINLEWEILKEKLISQGFEKHSIDSKKTKLYERYKDNTILVRNDIKSNRIKLLRVNKKYREIFGIKIN